MADGSCRSSTDLEEILARAGLSTLLRRFKSEKIDTPIIIESMSDEDLIRLGVTTIGDRIRIRESAKRQKAEKTDRPLQSERTFPGFRNLCTRQNRSTNRNNRRGGSYGRLTAQFYCLSSTDQLRTPTSLEKEILSKAGLGLKKVLLNISFSEAEVIKLLESEEGFPKLSTSGGFEMLRTQQNCRTLVPVPGPWTAKALQSNVGPQARIYLRPIQHSLTTEPIVQAAENEPSVTLLCEKCNLLYRVHELRAHVQQCRANTVESDAELPDLSFYLISNEQSNDQSTSQLLNSLDSEDTPIEDANIIQSKEETQLDNVDLPAVITGCIQFLRQKNISNPVEMLRKAQTDIIIGRSLEIEDIDTAIEGETNFISVDRNNLLQTSFEEIRSVSSEDMRKTLEVQFYNEQAADYGGPRKEFFRLVLMDIEEKYFAQGMRDLLAEDYKIVGMIFALSILQNGPVPIFLSSEVVEMIFDTVECSQAVQKLREGLNVLGVYDLVMGLPEMKFLFQPPTFTLTMKRVITMLKPVFSEDGTNVLQYEKEVYGCFIKYLREVAAGRRCNLTLSSILRFVTSTDEEPLLGFRIQPSIHFCEVKDGYLPTASTCVNSLTLPRPNHTVKLPQSSDLFELYDYAFSNAYYGLQ